MSDSHSFGKAEFHYRAQHVEGDKFRDGWDRIFGKKEVAPAKEETPTTRYFTDDHCVWKFAPGKGPKLRRRESTEWIGSIFQDIHDFMKDPGAVREITAEEGEP